MFARPNSAKMPQRNGQADRAVHAHAQVTHIVEEDHAADATGIGGRNKERSDRRIGAARLAG